jgi:hypothetical protein
LSKGSVDRSRRFSCLVGGMSSRRPAAQRAQPQPRAELRFCGMRLALEASAPARAAAGPVGARASALAAPLALVGDDLSADERAAAVRIVLNGDRRRLAAVSRHARWDLEVVLAAVSLDGAEIELAGRDMQMHPAVQLAAVKQRGTVLQLMAGLGLLAGRWPSRALLLAAVASRGMALQYASPSDQDDREVVLTAVTLHGRALLHASGPLRDDDEVVLAAVTQDGRALFHASERLRGIGWLRATDPGAGRVFKRVVLAAVTQHGMSLQDTSVFLKDDEDVVGAAVRQNGSALQYASVALRDNEGIVLAAVTQDGTALQYASAGLVENLAVVIAALTQTGFAARFVAPALMGDKDSALAMVTAAPGALNYASDAMLDDRDVVWAALQANGSKLLFAGDLLQQDKVLVLATLSRNTLGADGDCLRWASQGLRGDSEVVLAAVRVWGGALEHAEVPLRGDKAIVLAAVSQWGDALMWASVPLQRDRDVVLAAVTQDGYALEHAVQDLQADRDIVLAAAATSGFSAIKTAYRAGSAGRDFSRDRDVMLAAAGAVVSGPGVLSASSAELFMADATTAAATAAASANAAEREHERARDLELTLAAVAAIGLELQYASLVLQGNREVVLAALRSNGMALQWASAELRNAPDVVLAAISSEPHWLATTGGLGDPAFAPGARSHAVSMLRFAGPAPRADRAVALAAVKINGEALRYFAPALWRERELVLEAVLKREILETRTENDPRGRALDAYALSSCGWEADAFLREIAAHPPADARLEGAVGARRRLAFTGLDLAAPAGGGRAPLPSLAFDLLELIGSRTGNSAYVAQGFRDRAAAAGGFLHEGAWAGRRAEPV